MNNLIIDNNVTITTNEVENTITINAGDSRGKLSNLLSDFPPNCYIDKRITGCGGTTLVLRNNSDYVVLVPYVSILESKLLDNKGEHIIGVYSKTNTEKLESFLADTSRPRKIICTFDSLPRLLGTKGFEATEFKLLVDEAHTLINLGGFKARVCEFVLDNFTKFKTYNFMTATPTKREFFPSQLLLVPICTIEWVNLQAVSFDVQTVPAGTSYNSALFGLCFDYLTGKETGNAHIFYNSVSEISKVLLLLKEIEKSKGLPHFNSKDVRIVCADNNTGNLSKTLGVGWSKISTVLDPVAKINFYTSKAFEGSDIFDTEGKTYIAVNGIRDNTKLDIHTLVPQIVGRIRDSKHNHTATMIVGNLPDSITMTKETWFNQIEKSIADATEAVEALNSDSLTSYLRKVVEADMKRCKYVTVEDGKYKVSEVSRNAELQDYEALQTTYNTQAIEGIETTTEVPTLKDLLSNLDDAPKFKHIPTGIVKFLSGSIHCITETMREYCEDNNKLLNNLLDARDDYFKLTVKIIGAEKCKALKYSRKCMDLVVNDVCLGSKRTLQSVLQYKKGQIITKADLKVALQAAYDELGMTKKAKATDIKEYYKVAETKIKAGHAFRII